MYKQNNTNLVDNRLTLHECIYTQYIQFIIDDVLYLPNGAIPPSHVSEHLI